MSSNHRREGQMRQYRLCKKIKTGAPPVVRRASETRAPLILLHAVAAAVEAVT